MPSTGRTIEDLGKRDWSLKVRGGELVAAKTIPYDGVLTYTTEDKFISRRRNSQANLSVREVVRMYHEKSDTESLFDQLYADAKEIIDSVPGDSSTEADE